MLSKGFNVVATLHAMEQNVSAVVRTIKQSAHAIEIESPCVSAPFAEQLKLLGYGVVSPNSLLKFDSSYVGSDSASLAAIEPAVWPKCQRVRNAVRVLHPKSCQQNLRIRIWNIVAIAIRIKQQIRYIEHEHSAVTKGYTRG